MSNKCDYPNHCPDLKQAGENLLKQELKIKKLEHQNRDLFRACKSLVEFVRLNSWGVPNDISKLLSEIEEERDE